MFNLPFSSNSSTTNTSNGNGNGNGITSTSTADPNEGGRIDGNSICFNTPQHKSGNSRRSRRRRNARKTRVEPMQNNTKNHSSNSNSNINISTAATSVKHHDAPMTKNDLYFALDCEMVGIGPDGFDSAVARVTLINWEHEIVLDTFVKVPAEVTDYRTHVSGIRAADIESDEAISFEAVREAVEHRIRGKILIGHGLECDLCALGLTHPWCDVRDTARYAPYMVQVVREDKLLLRPRKLRDLAWEKLGRQIQDDCKPHCPIDDAAAALDLYKEVRADWEEGLRLEQAKKFQEQEQQQQQHQRSKEKGSFFWGGTPPPPPMPAYNSQEEQHVPYQHTIDPRVYNGPYGSKIPGFAPAPRPTAVYPSSDNKQPQSTSSRRWFSSRPKSPERHPIKEDEAYQLTSRPMSPRSSSIFSFRRSSAARLRGIQQAVSMETAVTTDSSFDWAGTPTTDDYGSRPDDYDWSHNSNVQQQYVDEWQHHGDQQEQHSVTASSIEPAAASYNNTPQRSRLATYLSATSQEAIAGGDDDNNEDTANHDEQQQLKEWQPSYCGEWPNNFHIPNLRS